MQHEYVDLRVVAARLGQPVAVLITLARAGRFPSVLRLTERRASVRRDELDRWLEESTISAGSAARQQTALAAAASGPAMPRPIRRKGRRIVEAST